MKNKLIISFSLLLAASGFYGCRKDLTDQQQMSFQEDRKAYVQWFNATVNSTRNYIYVNGIPMNGAAVGFGTVFPSSAFSFTVYSGTNGVTIKDTLATTTQVPQNFVQDFGTGRSYTIFTYDLATSPKRLIVENAAVNYPADNLARVRFINLVYAAPATVDIFSTALNQKLWANIPVAQLSNYLTFQPNVSDKWYVRLANTTTNIDSLSISTTTLTPKRFYTAVYRGNYPTASTRALNLFANN